MSKSKSRGLAGFNQVSDDTEIKVNTNISTELEQYYKRDVKVPKKQVSIYLDEDVIEAYNQFGLIEGKGARSDLVNNFLRKTFNIRQG